MITLTASFLNLAAAENPWSIESQFINLLVMLVLLGVTSVDVFFTLSSFVAFFRLHQYYKKINGFKLQNIISIYFYKLLKFIPTLYLVLLFGIYVKLHFNGRS